MTSNAATPTPADFTSVSHRERPYAALRLAVELGMGLVTVSRRDGQWLVSNRSGSLTLAEWYIRAVVRTAVLQVMEGAAR